MSDLAAMALQHTRELGDAVDIDDVIHTAREAFYKFLRRPDSYPGYLEHLKERLASAFEANEDGLEGIVSEVGGEPLSDRFLLENIISLYSLELSKVREENMALKALNEELCEEKDQQMPCTDAIDMYYAECEDLPPMSPSVEKDDLETPPSEPDSVYMYSALDSIKDGKGKKRNKKGKKKFGTK